MNRNWNTLKIKNYKRIIKPISYIIRPLGTVSWFCFAPSFGDHKFGIQTLLQ
jgi:hypothetical protein